MKSDLKQSDMAIFTVGGKTAELPVFKAAHGPDVVDVRSLYKETSAFTFDPGYTSTASCESKIT
ncbi:MAG: citrate (Si)-synthase, partial [Pseudomonadota bacterium]